MLRRFGPLQALAGASAALATTVFQPAQAQSHVETIATTPCLYEYRAWYFTFARSSSFAIPSAFTPEQCRHAAEVNSRLIDERAAAEQAMSKAPGPRDANERNVTCLLEYRVWMQEKRPDETLDDALRRFPPFLVQGPAECREAATASKAIDAQDASDLAIQQAAERRQLAADRRAAEAQRAKDVQASSARAAQAAKPGVRIGMTEHEVINNTHWGRPSEKNRRTTASGTREQWVYGGKNYLYFENGRLTAIDN